MSMELELDVGSAGNYDDELDLLVSEFLLNVGNLIKIRLVFTNILEFFKTKLLKKKNKKQINLKINSKL